MRPTRRAAAVVTGASALALAGAGLTRAIAPDPGGPGAPVITGIRANPGSANEGSRIEFIASVEAGDISALNFHWDFGDGRGSFEEPGAAATRYRYRDGGEEGTTYRVTLTVTDPSGRSATHAIDVDVNNVEPRIQFVKRDGAGLENAPIAFRAGASDPGRDDELTFEWDFGDGTTARGRRVEHRYRTPGFYSVALRVDDGDGGVAEEHTVVVIGEGGALAVDGDVHVGETALTVSTFSGSIDNAGRCMIRIGLHVESEASVGLSAVLPRGLSPGTYPIGIAERPTASWYDEYRSPGTVFASLSADARHHPPERGMFGLASQGGRLTISHFDGQRIELMLNAALLENTVPSANPPPRQVRVTAWLAKAVSGSIMRRGAIPESVYVCDIDDGSRMRVVQTEPALGAMNVDLDDPMIAVDLNAAVDMATVHDGTFRIEYRLPGEEQRYEEVPGVVEEAGDGGFRFVPVAPLLGGVLYRATLAGGEAGIRGSSGERLDRNHVWIFGTLVEPDAVRLAVYQVARNAPLVPGKTTLTRVYVDWSERPDVHPDWQVLNFPARVEVDVNGTRPYPSATPVTVSRPDQFSTADSAQAAHSINLFGWRPEGIGGTSTFTAVLKPVDPEGAEPHEFSSAPLTLPHHTAAPRLTYEAFRIRVNSWEEEVPATEAALIPQILREGAEFTLQNFPIVEFEGPTVVRDLPVSEPILYWGAETGDGIRTYNNPFDWTTRDRYFVRQVKNLLASWTSADVLILLFPKEVQPNWTGYAYTKSRPFTFSLFVPPEVHAQTVSVFTATLAHELGHAFGLVHTSACPAGQFQSCLNLGKAGSDEIEGFRLASDGSGGWNKSKTEGNAEAPTTGAVLSLMYDGAIGMPGLFILNEHYRELLGHRHLAMAAPDAATDGRRTPAAMPRYATAGFEPFTSLLGLRGAAARRTPAALDDQDDRSFVVSGIILPDDEAVGLEPVEVIDRQTREQEEGPYTLELLDASGGVLQGRSFATERLDPGHVTRDDGTIESEDDQGADASSGAAWFRVELPYAERPHAVRVRRGDTELVRFERSAAAPVVRFTSPASGTAVPDGPLTVTWSGEDADGDRLGYALDYSPDGDSGWRRITPWTADTRIRIDLVGLPEGLRPTLRIVASDGMREGADTLVLSPPTAGGDR